MKPFHHILINTLIANVTTNYLWFAMTFWVYLQTRDVALTGAINAFYMGLVAIGSIFFGSIVDHNRKKNVMMFAAVTTGATYLAAGGVWLALINPAVIGFGDAAFWLFASLILAGSVVEQMRNIALSTTVTLLVPEDERDKANGLVGTVQGAAFLVTSIISGASIGWLGMELTLWIALALTLVALLHLIPIKIPEREILTAAEAAAAVLPAETVGATAIDTATPVVPVQPGLEGASISKGIDLRGSLRVIRNVPGLLALILFTCFNNLIGGVYVALMDAYGLEMFSPQMWGFVLGVSSLGFIGGGILIAKLGLGKNPVRTLLLANVAVAVLGMIFGLREWWWLFAGGIFLFMVLMPFAEAAEQTILQRVVPFPQQGRVFGLAIAVEMAANPLSAVIIAIVAQAYVIPWMKTPEGQATFGWLLGEGTARGMALIFIISGMILLVIVLLALVSRPYRLLSRYYAEHTQDLAGSPTQ